MFRSRVDRPSDASPARSSPHAVVGLVGFYLAALVAATWPYAPHAFDELPSVGDPLQHLRVMRWYKECLLDGRSPLLCPGLQYPTGAPIGNFSPLHIQSFLYITFSFFLDNDILCYNLIWLTGFLTTGLATHALALHVLGDRAGALIAGLLAMLSGPMMVHSHAHTELIYVGGFPLFLLAWMRFVDCSGWRSLGWALGAYTLLAMCAAYFAVFAVFPATLYLLWRFRARGAIPWIDWSRRRVAWLLAFSLFSLALLGLLYAPQLWSHARGFSAVRPRSEFEHYGMSWWAYLVPSPGHPLWNWLPFDPHGAAGVTGEGMGYLGLVTLALLHRAAVLRLNFREAGFWWSSTFLLLVLSLGAGLSYEGRVWDLPSGWLRDHFPPFRLIRVPARFKLLVPVCAGVIAGAAWSDLRSRVSNRGLWRLISALVLTLAVFDLAHVPYHSIKVPRLPHAYVWLREHDPNAVWLEAPQVGSGDATEFHAWTTYWQGEHGGVSTVGYSGQQNRRVDNLATWSSPFFGEYLRGLEPAALDRPTHIDVVWDADFLSYTWLYLKVHQFRYLIFHRWLDDFGGPLSAVSERLEASRLYDDGSIAIHDARRLPKPTAPTLLCRSGWGGRNLLPRDGFTRLAGPSAELLLYTPDSRPIRIALRARALRRPRLVSLRTEAGDELARWTVAPNAPVIFQSPPIRLPAGLHQLRLVSDGAVPPERLKDRFESETRPASLVVSGLAVRRAEAAPASVAHQADNETLNQY